MKCINGTRRFGENYEKVDVIFAFSKFTFHANTPKTVKEFLATILDQ